MHKTPVLVLAVLVLAALAACGAPPPTKEYAYPAWGFVASFGAPPKVTETPPAPGRPHSLLLQSSVAGRDYVVSVGEGVKPQVTLDQIGPNFARRAAQLMGGEVGTMTYASTAEKVMGLEFAVTKDGKPYATIRTYLANDRFYEIGAQSPLGPDDPVVKDFLDTFRITKAPPAVPPPPANAAPANATPANGA